MKGSSKETNKFLYFAAATVNLASFSCGIAFAWSSPVIPKLNGISGPNPLETPITKEEESWIASLISLGATVGTLIGGYASDKFGRKKTLLLSLTPIITSYVMSAFATNIATFYAARIVIGISAGIVLTVVPMYIGEIAEIGNRGILGCCMAGFMTVGNLFSFTVGPYLSVKWFNLVCLIGPVVCMVMFALWIPESPYHLVAKNRQNEARKSLLKYRCNDKDLAEKELLEITLTVKESAAVQGGISDLFKSKGLFKGLIITVGLIVLQQLTGISVILFYMQSIFDSAGSGMSSEVSTIFVGVVQIMGVFCAIVIVDKLGRKLLLFVSMVGSSLMLASLGTYFFLKENGYNVDSIFWLPVTSLIVYIALYNVGMGPLPYTILGELFPPHVKSIASTITVGICLIVSFCTSKFFPLLIEFIGMGCSFWLFAACTTLGVIFLTLVVPETKGKSLNEILAKLNK